jgi:hypothetical protein
MKRKKDVHAQKNPGMVLITKVTTLLNINSKMKRITTTANLSPGRVLHKISYTRVFTCWFIKHPPSRRKNMSIASFSANLKIFALLSLPQLKPSLA